MSINRPFEIDFYSLSKSELIKDISALADQSYCYIVTPNINHIVQLKSNTPLRLAYENAKYRVCDSKILFPILTLLGKKIEEVIPGSTLTVELLSIANSNSWTIVVIGCERSEIQKLEAKYENITFRHHNPPMGFIKDTVLIEECVEFIIENPAQLIVFSVGCPQQEILAHRISMKSNVTGVGLCAGASLNFASGKNKRAPLIIQKIGLEWLHRILMEPRRLARRYLSDAIKLAPILVEELTKRK
ncbi:N-acetylglucosaminyldiphosphoundecaprenol N-acetyl-beta-D-mannosaminyltransferase [compost metagenome]